jgi:uroporphyrinogen-III synthase
MRTPVTHRETGTERSERMSLRPREDRPLPTARTAVLVTRPPPGGQRLAELLTSRGFEVHLIPALVIVPPEDLSPLDAAASRAAQGGYDWIVVTSANGVRALWEALAKIDKEPGSGAAAAVPRAKIAAVGSATAEAAKRAGWSVELVPESFTGEGLLAAFEAIPIRGGRVLLAVAETARGVVPQGLSGRGADVDVVVAYRSAPAAGAEAARLRALLSEGRLDLVTLASPSAAEGVLEMAGSAVLGIPAAVIGPVTADAARALGFDVVAVADPHTAEGLADAVAGWANPSLRAP